MTNQLETTQAPWSDSDAAFFRIAAKLMDPDFVRGAGALLASYDVEPAPRPARSGKGASHTRRFVQAPV